MQFDLVSLNVSTVFDKRPIVIFDGLTQGFEEASQPTLSDIDRRNLLSFRIVGAGPTGVEFAAELHDLVNSDIKRHYGEKLSRLVRITLYDVAPRMLGGFEHGLAE